jgi:exopolysaccharide/PEP-CTERM locus tyrosine autokinase
VSTIDQAAKRLAQLRRAGVEVQMTDADTAASHGSASVASRPVPVPLRVATHAGRHAAEEAAAPPPGYAESAGAAGGDASSDAGTGTRVDIDLAGLADNGCISPQVSRSRIAEEFRVIKRPLINNVRGKSAAPVRNANRIMVTSALPGEGKTFCSVNLAISLASEVDTKVLLVDADVLRPALLDRLGLAPSPRGLLDMLIDHRITLSDAVLQTNIERLSILPAGTSHPHATELLASDGMNQLIERLASDEPRRIVVFDTPPLLVTSESRVLASHMGQVIMVIGADDTPQATVVEGLATIESCPVVFTLLNRVPASDRSGYYYGSYGSYAR